MVRIRFARYGLKRQPFYRIVVSDQRKARRGKSLEIIGHHNPRTRPALDEINDERALYWLSVGAQPSDAVKRLMQRTGTWARFERLRQGESMETLVAEAVAAKEAAEPISLRTRYPSPAAGQGKNAKQAAAELVEEESVAVAVAEEVEEEIEEPESEEPVAEEAVEEPAAEETTEEQEPDEAAE